MKYLRPFLCWSVLSFGLIANLSAQTSTSTPVYDWSTMGGRSTLGREDGDRLTARFNHPRGMVRDSAGALYVADSGNHTIRRISIGGTVSTFVGTAGQRGRVDGTGAAARFDTPIGLAIDGANNLYVTDAGNFTIRKITSAGVVTTLAGTPGQSGTADGTATSSLFTSLGQIASDAAGIVYVIDHGIRKIADGKVTTVFASGSVTDSAGTTYTAQPDVALAINAAGELYFSGKLTPWSTPGPVLLKLDQAGNVSFLVQPQEFGTDPINPHFTAINFITADTGSTFYYGASQRVYYGIEHFVIYRDGAAATWNAIYDASNIQDQPLALVKDSTGRTLYTRASDSAIRDLAPSGSVFAGNALLARGVDGTISSARFTDIRALTLDSAGNAWVADDYLRRIVENDRTGGVYLRKIAGNGVVNTTYHFPASEDVYPTFALSLTSDSSDNLSLATRKFVAGVTRFAANGSSTPLPDAAEVRDAIVLAASGNTAGTLALMGAQGALRTWDPVTNQYPLLAGSAEGFSVRGTRKDGTGVDARFASVMDMKADKLGNFYVLDSTVPALGDTGDAVIRKVTPAGVVTTFSRNLVITPTGGGTRILPLRLALDSKTRFYLLYTDATVRLLGEQGDPAIVGGASGREDNVDGRGTLALFSEPSELASDAQDNLYVADQSGTVVRKGQLLGTTPVITTQPASQSAAAGTAVSLSVVASADPAPTYQWQREGAAIAGATSATYSIVSLSSTSTGAYTVVVTNAAGSVTSNTANVSISSSGGGGGGSGGGGGGGAPSTWFLGLLAAVSLLRAYRSRIR